MTIGGDDIKLDKNKHNLDKNKGILFMMQDNGESSTSKGKGKEKMSYGGGRSRGLDSIAESSRGKGMAKQQKDIILPTFGPDNSDFRRKRSIMFRQMIEKDSTISTKDKISLLEKLRENSNLDKSSTSENTRNNFEIESEYTRYIKDINDNYTLTSQEKQKRIDILNKLFKVFDDQKNRGNPIVNSQSLNNIADITRSNDRINVPKSTTAQQLNTNTDKVLASRPASVKGENSHETLMGKAKKVVKKLF